MRRRTVIHLCVTLLGFCTAFTPFIWDTLHQLWGYKRVSLQELGKFDFDDEAGVISDVPQIFRKFDGRRIVVVGKMYSPSEAPAVVDFQLVYDLAQHRWGPPRVQERIFARMRSGTVPLQGPYELVEAYGTLHVRLKRNQEGTIVSVYDMDVDRVICAPQPGPAPWWIVGVLVGSTFGVLTIVDLLLLWGVGESRGLAGRCTRCGYDLRASPDRCPECGTRASRATQWSLAMDRAQTDL